MKYLVSNESVYNDTSEEITLNGFPAGVYSASYNSQTGIASMSSMQLISDELVNLVNSKYEQVLNNVNRFFSRDVQALYKQYGFLYKKSILLHGTPGNGKTCLAIKVANEFRSHNPNGIVLFAPRLEALSLISSKIKSDVPLLIIFEEFDSTCQDYREDYILSMLDGEIQRDNTFFIFTTNFIDKIPNRLFRPGRISDKIEITPPNAKTRLAYLQFKCPNNSKEELQEWATKMKGFSLDDLKHSVLSIKCMGQTLDEVIESTIESHKYLDKQSSVDDNEEELFTKSIRKIMQTM